MPAALPSTRSTTINNRLAGTNSLRLARAMAVESADIGERDPHGERLLPGGAVAEIKEHLGA
jgi:hypothetical protein